MEPSLKPSLDRVIDDVTDGTGREDVPGVVAMVTDRQGDIYRGVRGKRDLSTSEPMTEDTVFAIFSTTKAIGGTAVLQLVEEGRLDLDAPAKAYAPRIGEIEVLEGFDDDGTPRTRKPKSDITTRQLMLHTAGFGYDFFNQSYRRLVRDKRFPGIVSGKRAALMTPLLFDPGERWEYGSNVDWTGQVVEGVTGQRLGAVLKERIFEPLGMTDIAFTRTEDMKARTATIHSREKDGGLKPMAFALPDDPEVQMAGHGLYASVPDYMKFIRMWLNDGDGPHGRVLGRETVEMAVRNDLKPHQPVMMLPGVHPGLSNDVEFFPGLRKGWGHTFMTVEEDAPTGRPKGSVAWAGLANLYYWIDRRNGLGGFWATQIFPFADAASIGGYLDFETAVYAAMGDRAAA